MKIKHSALLVLLALGATLAPAGCALRPKTTMPAPPTATTAGPTAGLALDELKSQIAHADYGERGDEMDKIRTLVANAQHDPQLREQMETWLDDLLAGQTTPAARQFACTQLYLIGTGRSVPVLAHLLADPATADSARYGLEQIKDPTAGKALREAIKQTNGKARAGVITTLGERRDARAWRAMAHQLKTQDQAVAQAAAVALSKIGGRGAARALLAAQPASQGAQRSAIDGALLICADRLLAEGQSAPARKIYERLYQPENSPATRAGALTGLVKVNQAGTYNLVLANLEGQDVVLRQAAASALRLVPNTPARDAKAETRLPNVTTGTQALFIAAMADAGPEGLWWGRFDATRAVTAAAASDQAEVRQAAIEALAKLGDKDSIGVLADVAAGRGDEAKLARASLARLARPEINPAIMAAIPAAKPKVQAALVRALADRQATDCVPALLELATKGESPTRRAACAALGNLAPADQLAAMVQLMLKETDGAVAGEAEKAVATAARRMTEQTSDTLGAGQAVLAALPKSEVPPAGRCSLLRVLGQLSDDKTLDSIRADLASSDPTVREAAVRALLDWQTAAPLDNLLDLAKNGPSDALRTLSLRAALRLLEQGKDLPAERRIGAYEQALTLAASREDKVSALNGLAHIPEPRVADIIRRQAKDKDLREDAERALEQVSRVRWEAQGFYPVARLANVKVDGDLADWPGLSETLKDETSRVQASLRLGWDNRGLLVAVQTSDDKPQASPLPELMWQRDSLQLALDPANERTKGNYGANSYELGFGLTNDSKPVAHAWRQPEGTAADLTSRCPVAITWKDGMLTYEALIPWDLLRVGPVKDGQELGLDVAVNDADEGDEWAAVEWTPGVLKDKDASKWKHLKLVNSLK